jgi:hypothetical protein
VSDEDADEPRDGEPERDPDALRSRANELKTQLRVLRMRAESANFEDREAYARALREKEEEIERLRRAAELADVDVSLEFDSAGDGPA